MIRISNLIDELEAFKELNGDLIVVSKEDGFGGYAICASAGICEETENVGGYEVAHGGEGGMVTDEMITELFPDWDGDHDRLDAEDPQVSVAVLAVGNMICST